ncbi:hypothetical protein [Gulosibacter faecalis]|uniref:Uncharacterized protein n=1 Tax=Gulosibacter faecalis TaxID=272240 RepID=A0ABW5UTW7_9MICO|nr:hypothetical protein [Gulosibacter faecalis]
MPEIKPDKYHVGEIVFTDNEILIDGHRIGYLAIGPDIEVKQVGAEYKATITIHAMHVRFDTAVTEATHYTPRPPLVKTAEEEAVNGHAQQE